MELLFELVAELLAWVISLVRGKDEQADAWYYAKHSSDL
jgi:hypothetical protein